MGKHKRKKTKRKLEEIRYEDVTKYSRRRKRGQAFKGIGKSLKGVGRRTSKSLLEARRKSKPALKKFGKTVKKGIEYEKKAFKFGAKAISKGWEYGFEKPFELQEKSRRIMEKQKRELGI